MLNKSCRVYAEGNKMLWKKFFRVGPLVVQEPFSALPVHCVHGRYIDSWNSQAIEIDDHHQVFEINFYTHVEIKMLVCCSCDWSSRSNGFDLVRAELQDTLGSTAFIWTIYLAFYNTCITGIQTNGIQRHESGVTKWLKRFWVWGWHIKKQILQFVWL